MSKWYEVKVTVVMIYVIEVPDNENEREAIEIALNEAPMGGDAEAEAAPLLAQHVEGCKRHADIVRTISGEGDKG